METFAIGGIQVRDGLDRTKRTLTEAVTDTLRCLYLEAWGYQTRIQGFVGTEHTAKNLLIVASRTDKSGPRPDLINRALEFQRQFGIENQRLGTLLLG